MMSRVQRLKCLVFWLALTVVFTASAAPSAPVESGRVADNAGSPSSSPAVKATKDIRAKAADLPDDAHRFKVGLVVSLVLGTTGAAWFTLLQRRLADASPSSCLQLLMIILLIVGGAIGSVYCLWRLHAG